MKRLTIIALLLWAPQAPALETPGVTDWLSSSTPGNDNMILLMKITTVSAITATAIVGDFNIYGQGDTLRTFKGMLYDASLNLVACTDPYQNGTSENNGWWYLMFPSPPSLSATTDYYAGIWISDEAEGPPASATLRVETSGGAGVKYKSVDYDAAGGVCPDPLSGETTQAGWKYSIYIYGTEGDETSLPIHSSKSTWRSEDTYIEVTDDNPNEGAVFLRTGEPFLKPTHYAAINFDPDSVENILPSGATLDSVHYIMTCYSASGTDTLSLWPLWKPFFVNNMTGLSWYEGGPGRPAPPDSNWGLTTGNIPADSADDSGSDNRSDGDDEDRNATSMMDLVVDTTGTYSWTLDNNIWDDWKDGTRAKQGFVIGQRIHDATSTHDWRSRQTQNDHLDTPGFVVFFTRAAGSRHRKVLMQSQ